MRIKNNSLVSSEIRGINSRIVWTSIEVVVSTISIKIILANITTSVSIRILRAQKIGIQPRNRGGIFTIILSNSTCLLIRIENQHTIVLFIEKFIIIGIRITFVSHSVTVSIQLIGIGITDTVVTNVRNTVTIRIIIVVTNVAQSVFVVISLITIRNFGTIVTCITEIF